MEFDEVNLHEIMNIMERGQEKLEDLQDQRDELFEANKRLVELVKQLEVALEESKGGSVRFEGSEYSFRDGWMPTEIIHDKSLDLSEDIDIDDVDRQVDEVIKSMKNLEDLNQKNKG